MLNLTVTEITHNAAGPVIHMTEPGGAKVELYLPKGYDVPVVGAAFELAPATADSEIEASRPLEQKADPLASGSAPSCDAPADTATDAVDPS
jgi:hypothetical protein